MTVAMAIGILPILVWGTNWWTKSLGLLLGSFSGLALGVCQGIFRLCSWWRELYRAARKLRAPGFLRRGLFSGQHFEEFLDECLKESPRFRPHADLLRDARVTFGWVDDLRKRTKMQISAKSPR